MEKPYLAHNQKIAGSIPVPASSYAAGLRKEFGGTSSQVMLKYKAASRKGGRIVRGSASPRDQFLLVSKLAGGKPIIYYRVAQRKSAPRFRGEVGG